MCMHGTALKGLVIQISGMLLLLQTYHFPGPIIIYTMHIAGVAAKARKHTGPTTGLACI